MLADLSTRRRLSQLLLASHLGALLLFAALLLASGGGTIRAAVVGQARTESERAISEARKRLLERAKELGVTADLLAEQPTLRYYLQTRQLTKARELVADFHATSDVEYLRVEWEGRVLGSAGSAPPRLSPGLSFDRDGGAWRVLRRSVPDLPQAVIAIAEPLRERLRAEASFVDVRLSPMPGAGGATVAGDRWSEAIRTVAETGEPMTLESVGSRAAGRIVRLRTEAGEPAAILSASVADEWVRRRVLEWHAAFGAAMALALLLAMALASLVAARIARPFAKVADDAERLGDGDLETAVPRPETFLAEPVRLADSLEKMRAQVARSTAAERRQREELDTVLDGVDEGILAVDQDERVHYANRQVLALLKRQREDVLGRMLDEIIEPARPAVSTPTDAALPTHGSYTAPGLLRPLTVRRLPASGDRQVLVVREENALEAARAMRDRILANLSHEFQTPLSAQIASIELLRDYVRKQADPVAIRLVDAQYRGTVRLSQLVENLLDSVRIESGEMRLRRQRVDLAQVAADALSLMQPLLDLRGQRVVAQLEKGPGLVGDAQRLHSTLVNLLANANKFSHTGSTIWLELDWQEGWVTAWVEDEGPGLPPSLTVRDLFAPFLRAPHEEPSQRGSGLGLAIVHAIVAAHGGQVRVETPRHGGGARIGIVLPVGAEA
jgi:signal transduction histidine kinase